MTTIKIAYRNVLRNKRRTILNTLMISGGFAAIILFNGFSSYVSFALETANVRTIYGHSQVARPKYWDRTPVDDQNEKLITDPGALIEKIKKIPEVRYASTRLSFFTLINSREISTSGQGLGIDPLVEADFMSQVRVLKGENLSGKSNFEIIMGVGVAKQIQAKVGETVSLVAQTVDGSANAIDFQFRGIFASGVAEFDNTTVILPLAGAQKLMSTQGGERIMVMLNNGERLSSKVEKIQSAIGSPSEILARPWKSLSKLYQQVEEFWLMQNTIVEVILGSIVLLGIINTVGMSIYERTGEIGTVRALGDKQSDVLKQFVLEGFVLSILSTLIALPATFLLIGIVNNMGLHLDIPGSTLPMPVRIRPNGFAFLKAVLVIGVTTIVATLVPALRASRIEIVEALRKNN